MFVSPITPIITRVNSNSSVRNKENITKTGHNNIIFRQHYDVKMLDQYLSYLDFCRAIHTNARTQEKQARKTLKEIRKVINKIIHNNPFLWQIMPKESMSKKVLNTSDGITVYSYDAVEKKNEESVFIERLKSNKKSDIIYVQNVLNNVGDMSNIPEYDKLLKKLQGYIKLKKEKYPDFEENVLDIYRNVYSECIDNAPDLPANIDIALFKRELIQRAFDKTKPETKEKAYPELEKIFLDRTKYHSNKRNTNPDMTPQDKAYEDLFFYLKYGIADAKQKQYL